MQLPMELAVIRMLTASQRTVYLVMVCAMAQQQGRVKVCFFGVARVQLGSFVLYMEAWTRIR
jgi:hypothetical protein